MAACQPLKSLYSCMGAGGFTKPGVLWVCTLHACNHRLGGYEYAVDAKKRRSALGRSSTW